jgi:hypothetical protein
VTAEFAIAVPAVLVMLAVCLGGLRIGTERLRLVDAAAQSARLAALGASPEAPATSVGATVATRTRTQETVCVALRREVVVLGASVPIDATACALAGISPR